MDGEKVSGEIMLHDGPVASKDKEIFKIGETTHYESGKYTVVKNDLRMVGSIYEFYDIVSVQFNQLKAKLFNLVEASVTETKQREAMKGLIKGFCNQQYNNTIGDLEGWMAHMGFKIEQTPKSSDPLSRGVERVYGDN